MELCPWNCSFINSRHLLPESYEGWRDQRIADRRKAVLNER
jgi:hypothetical protein